jgi:hypothetical protein
MFNIFRHKRYVNLNYIEIPSYLSEWKSSRKQETNAGEDAGEKVTLIHCWWDCEIVQPL